MTRHWGIGRRTAEILCLLVVVVMCVARVEALSSSRHATNHPSNQGVAGKSRIIKTDSTISQQDQEPATAAVTTIKNVGSTNNSGESIINGFSQFPWYFQMESPSNVFFFLGLGLNPIGSKERRVRKRSKWLQSTTSSSTANHQGSSASYFNKDGTFLKRIVTEVIAERDAQIAAALFEVAKNQPHLQMMVQTVRNIPLPHARALSNRQSSSPKQDHDLWPKSKSKSQNLFSDVSCRWKNPRHVF